MIPATPRPFPLAPPRWGSTIQERRASFRAAAPRWRGTRARFPAPAQPSPLVQPACRHPETRVLPAIRARACPRTAGNRRRKPVHPGSARKTPQSRSGILRAPPAAGICRASAARDFASAGSNGPPGPAAPAAGPYLSPAIRRRRETYRASLLFRVRPWLSPRAPSFRPRLFS